MSTSTARRELLRTATAEAHQGLDARVGTLDLTHYDHYRRFLIGNAAALLAVEALLEHARVTERFPDWPQRSRRASMLADLAGLGATVEPLQWSRVMPDRAEMFGIIYVLEGSRLGARMLLPRAQASPDPRIRENCRFLSAQQPTLWREFLHELESASEPSDQNALLAGALDTFELFTRSFEQALA
jgi:heme oxygenase (biliverdin-IX-beta and delta-forming)